MSESIGWSLDVQVVGGPKLSLSEAIVVDAYDKLGLVVPAASGTPPTAGKVTVEVQPGTADKVQFLLLTSSIYDPKLTYKVGTGADIKLDAPILLVGAGAVGLLGQAQQNFVFSNNVSPAQAASVTILVGRKATS